VPNELHTQQTIFCIEKTQEIFVVAYFFFFEFPHNNEQHQTHSTMNNRNNIDDKEHIKRREHNSYYFLSLSHSVQGQTFENEKSTFMEYIIDETLFYDPRAEHLARRR